MAEAGRTLGVEEPAATGLLQEIIKNAKKRKGVTSDVFSGIPGSQKQGKRTKPALNERRSDVSEEPRQGTSKDSSDIAPPLSPLQGVTSSGSSRSGRPNLVPHETSGKMAEVEKELAMHSQLWTQQADIMSTISQRLPNMERKLGGMSSASPPETSETDDEEIQEIDDEIDAFLTTEPEEDDIEQDQKGVDIMAEVEGFLLESAAEGPEVEAKLAKIVNSGLRASVQHEKLKTLQEKYLKPSNCTNLTVRIISLEKSSKTLYIVILVQK